MTDIAPGWYPDPADVTTQRYWDGEGWIGEAIPVDAIAPEGPPANAPAAPPEPEPPAVAPSAPAGLTHPAAGQPASGRPDAGGSGAGGAGASGAGVGGRGVSGGRPWPAAGQPIPPAWLTGYPGAPVRPHGLALASAGTRLAARLIDVLAVLGLCVIANAWFAYQIWTTLEPLLADSSRAVLTQTTPAEVGPEVVNQFWTLLFMMVFVAVAVWFAYEVPGTANSGQTLGKRIMQIKVMRLESEERLGFGRSWRRWSRLGVPTLLWPCCGVGLALQALDCLSVVTDRPLRRALHDKAAATIVVQVPRPSNTPASPNAYVGGRDADSRKP